MEGPEPLEYNAAITSALSLYHHPGKGKMEQRSELSGNREAGVIAGIMQPPDTGPWPAAREHLPGAVAADTRTAQKDNTYLLSWQSITCFGKAEDDDHQRSSSTKYRASTTAWELEVASAASIYTIIPVIGYKVWSVCVCSHQPGDMPVQGLLEFPAGQPSGSAERHVSVTVVLIVLAF